METDERQADQANTLTADYMEMTAPLFDADREKVHTACTALLWHFKYLDKFPFAKLRAAFRQQLSMEAPNPKSQYEWICCGFLTGLDATQ